MCPVIFAYRTYVRNYKLLKYFARKTVVQEISENLCICGEYIKIIRKWKWWDYVKWAYLAQGRDPLVGPFE
jgi:uncharacterized protein with HEPN domain